MGIFSWIIDGLIASWLARLILKDRGFGLIGNSIVGVIGGLLSGWIATSLMHIGPEMSGINLESILVTFFGAVLLLIGLRFLSSRSKRTVYPKNTDPATMNRKEYKGRLSWK